MTNTALQRTIASLLLNSSGGNVSKGDVVIVGSSVASSFTTTTTVGLQSDLIGVALEDIPSGSQGMVAVQGYVPKINLSASASLGDTFCTHSVAKQAVPHSLRQIGDFGQVLTTGSTPEAILFTVVDRPAIAVLRDEKAANTQGGASTSGSWLTRDLNTEVYDPYGIVSLSANQFTLQAGTYKIRVTSPFMTASGARIRLRNITDSTTTCVGTSAYNQTPDLVECISTIDDVFTISAAKVFEIQYRVVLSRATNGLGVSGGDLGEVEVYTRVFIEKID